MIRQTAQRAIREQRQVRYFDSGARCAELRVTLLSDPPGVLEEIVPDTTVAVHVGTPVRVQCRHGDERHAGFAIHGDVDIIPSGVAARWEMKAADTALVMALSNEYLARVGEECSRDGAPVKVRSRFQVRDPQIEHIAWALRAEAEQDYPSGPLFLESMARALSVQLLRRHSAHAVEPRDAAHRRFSPWEVRQALEYIEANIANDVRVHRIAHATNVSSSHLEVLFRQTTGMPVHQYVIRRRVDRAVLLLKHSSLPISEIALRTGFAHQSHLALHLRRLTGASPKHIRAHRARPRP